MIAFLTQRVSAFASFFRRFTRSSRPLVATFAAMLGFVNSAYASEAVKPDGQMVSRNEEAKAELFYYVEFKAVTPGQPSSVKGKTYNGYSFSDVDLGTGTAANTNTWLASSISKIENEIAINKVYKLPALSTANVERYRYRLMPPSGYETYFRIADSSAAFQPGSILEETPGSAGFEVVIMPTNQSGALPGKSTAVNPTDGSMSFALGFLTNGRSAGFLDFLPKIDYQKDAGTDGVSVWFGRALSAADLNCVRLNEEIEVVSMTLPALEYSPATSVPALRGVRQVIAPQTVVDVTRAGFDLLIKFYHPSQRGSRLSSEASPYGGETINYPIGSGPFTFVGDPVVSYRVNWTNGVTLISTNTTSNPNSSLPPTVITTKHEQIYSNLTVTRTEGADVKTATITQQEFVAFTGGYVEWFEDISTCGECSGMGQVWGDVDCGYCEEGRFECTDCGGSGDSDSAFYEVGTEWIPFKCSTCNGLGVMECITCDGDGVNSGFGDCGNCEGEGYFSDVDYVDVPSSISYDSTGTRTWVVNGFGVHTTNTVSTAPGSSYQGGIAYQAPGERPYHSHMNVSSYDPANSQVRSTMSSIYEGGFPAFRSEFVDNTRGSLATYDLSEGTQKVKASISGSNRLLTLFSYYRLATTDSGYSTHHGRLKWRKGPDGSWEMLEYSEDPSSLGQVTRVVRSYLDTPIPGWPTNSATGQGWEITATGASIVGPNLDTAMPATIPSGESITGLRVTNTTYTTDWEGVKRLPAEVIETADGQRVGHSKYAYSTETANSQPVWVSESWTYPDSASDNSNSAALYSRSKVYQGRLANGTPVSPWLQGLPYSSESPDGSKVSMAYHRGTWDAGTKTFTASVSGTAFRAVALKGSSRSDSGGTLTSTYDGTTIDSLYLSTNFSTASVTIRDANANTVRTETRIFTGSGWELVGAADMQYDVAGNLIRREELNGGLYEAIFTNANGASTAFSAISFNNNSGTRTGRKEYERDAQGLITKFYYDTEGRVEKTMRLATPACAAAPSGVPAITTVFTYDVDNRILTTTLKGAASDGSDDIVSTKTYDTAGQVLSESSQGLTTSYAQTVVNGVVTSSTTTLPGGATRIQTTYLDGRPKAITGTAAPAQYFSYEISSGREVTTTYLGSSNSSRWSKTYADWADRTVRTETSGHNGTAAETLVQTAEFNTLGQQTKTQTASLAPMRYLYDGNGVMTESGTDLDNNGSLGSSDRRQKTGYGFKHDPDVWSRYGGDTATWWSYSEAFAFPDGETAGKRVSRTWTRATHFNRVSGPPGIAGVAIAETVTADANDNRTVTQTFLDRANGTVTTVIHSPFAAQPSIAVAVAERVVSATSPAGVTTQTVYDSVGRPVKSIDRTSTGYSGNNTEYYPGTTRVKSVTDNRGVRQHLFTYDSAGRLVSDTTPKINASTGATDGYVASRFAYNAHGQLTHSWGEVPYPVMYEYDATTGEKTAQYTFRNGTDWSQASWPGGSGDKTAYEYYAETGLLKKKTDANNQIVTFTYNLRGQTVTATSSREIVRRVEYFDTTGELKRIWYTGETGGYTTPEVSYTYDRLGRTKTIKDAAGDRTFTYRSTDLQPEAEQFGRGVSPTPTHLLGTNRQFNYLYEAGTGRAIGLDLAAGSVSEYSVNYGYDPVSGRLKSITSGAGVFQYSYLANSNLISSVSSGGYVQSRGFEANRNTLTSLTVDTAAGRIAGYSYTHDDLGRRRWQEQSGSLYGAYVTGAEVMRTVYGYDDRNEVTSAETKVGDSGSVNTAAYLPGRGFGYDYDPIGNRKTEKFDGVSHTYNANALNQYTSRATPSYLPVSGTANKSGGASLSVNGSALGSEKWKNNYFYHQVSKAQTTGPGFQSITLNASASGGGTNQAETATSLTRPINETFAYDLDGNLIEDGLWHYAYDGENRLRAMYAKVADATGAPQAVFFTYDYMGRRVLKSSHSYSGTYPTTAITSQRSKTYFVYQGWCLVAEYDDNSGSIGTLRRRFTWGAALAGTADVGSLLAIEDLRSSVGGVPPPRTSHAVHDANGNLTALTDAASGFTVAEYEYDPFGNVLRSSGRYGKENPFRFAGKYLDAETGLLYYGFRYYSASLGRFINRDPIGEAGGLNIYGFANNDGINGGDLLGLAWYNPFSWNWGRALKGIGNFFGGIGKSISTSWNNTKSQSANPTNADNKNHKQNDGSAPQPMSGEVVQLDPYFVTVTKEKPEKKGRHVENELETLFFLLDANQNGFINIADEIGAAANKTSTLNTEARLKAFKALIDADYMLDRVGYIAEEVAFFAPLHPKATTGEFMAILRGAVPVAEVSIAAPSLISSGSASSQGSAPSGTTASLNAPAPGSKATVGGVNATVLPGRLSNTQMAGLQSQHGVEFAQVYLTGPGKNGGGGTYYLIKGESGSVLIPLGSNVRLINHTHPVTLNGQQVPLRASEQDRIVMQRLQGRGSPQTTSRIVTGSGKVIIFRIPPRNK